MNDPHWLDAPRNIRLLWRLFLGALALTVGAELLVEPHPHFWIDGRFAFHAWYGLLACAAMIVVAKLLGMALKRRDTYYESCGSEGRHD